MNFFDALDLPPQEGGMEECFGEYLAEFKSRLKRSFEATPPCSLEGVVREILCEEYVTAMLSQDAEEWDSFDEEVKGEIRNEITINLIRRYESGEMRRVFVDALLADVLKDIKPDPNFF
jgi:hypothetical protein